MNGYSFTDRVRRVLQVAREAALGLQQDRLGPEHLLLALVEEGGGVASTVLAEQRIVVEDLRKLAEAAAPMGRSTEPRTDLPYTSRAKRVFEYTMSEAKALRHNYVGTEHLLLALLHPDSTPAVTVLNGLGVTLENARAIVARLRPPQGPEPALKRSSIARTAFVLALIALLVALVALALALRSRPL